MIEDRLDAPSGLGYSLQNRIITRQALPDVFHHAPVQRLHRFFRDYRESLEHLAPQREDARIVLLSPGAANETYFEQAYLSNYLGYTLVEGEDLTTRNRKVFPPHRRAACSRWTSCCGASTPITATRSKLDPNSLLGVPG